MAAAILGKKIGMTRYYTEEGVNVPVTVVQAGPCIVSQIKTPDTDGYAAIQLAFDEVKPRRSTQPSKGKGFAGTMKRHNFKGQLASHGVERKHRSPGSIGGHALNAGGSGGLKKGKKMAGQMGNVRTTVRSLDIVAVDKDKNLLLIKGAVPGSNRGLVFVREAGRLYRNKAAKVKAAG